jgi:sulfate permease, SulP family
MYYANSQLLLGQVQQLIDGAQPPPRWFCIDAEAVDDLDYSAAETLRSIAGTLKERGIRMVFAVVSGDVRQEMDRSEITRLVGEEAFYAAVGEVLNAYRDKTGSS